MDTHFPSLNDIRFAAVPVINLFIHKLHPQLHPPLNEMAGCGFISMSKILQKKVGAFKARGASQFCCHELTDEQKKRFVATHLVAASCSCTCQSAETVAGIPSYRTASTLRIKKSVNGYGGHHRLWPNLKHGKLHWSVVKRTGANYSSPLWFMDVIEGRQFALRIPREQDVGVIWLQLVAEILGGKLPA